MCIRDRYFTPIKDFYPETTFGGDFETEADYTDPFIEELIQEEGGWTIWPLIPYSYDTIVYEAQPSPSAPGTRNWLGTDDQARDVTARLLYGFRVSVLFGLILTVVTSVIGIAAGAVQGYFGGWTDLIFQRVIEIWGSIPSLFVIIIIAAIIEPSFWVLLGILAFFSWPCLLYTSPSPRDATLSRMPSSA